MIGATRVCHRCYGLEECVIGQYYQCPKCDTHQSKEPTPPKESALYRCDECSVVDRYYIESVAAGEVCREKRVVGWLFVPCKGRLVTVPKP